ncbi:MAG: phospho-sugar mutase [Methylococcales bacterium]
MKKSGNFSYPSPTNLETSLRDVLVGLTSGLLGSGDPLRLAQQIVIETANRYQADISTLFRVEGGNRLVLKGGVARLGQEQRLPDDFVYDIPWHARSLSELRGEGLTVAVAVLGHDFEVNNYDDLLRFPAHAGRWDTSVYPNGVNDPETGFGCLYAVPLRLTANGEPRSAVAGVFKIERRRHRPPFRDVDRAGFQLVAVHLGQILRNSAFVNLAVERHAGEVLRELRLGLKEEIETQLSLLPELNDMLERESVETQGIAFVFERVQDNLPELAGLVNEICDRVRQDLGGEARPIGSIFPVLRAVEVRPTNAPPAGDGHLASMDQKTVLERARMRRIEAGFSALDVPNDARRTALANLRTWLSADLFRPDREQLAWLIEQQKWAILLDSFHRVLPFGTGGRRGPVGIGTNRFNPYTLMSSVQGHVDYLRELYPDRDLTVVVVYDVRVFRDLRGVYNPELPNPLGGMTSRDFARLAYSVYTANSVRVYTLPEESRDYVSTPELSFMVRRLRADGGLNISASHNHPDDNGGKFYNAYGAQDVPPNDEQMAQRVEGVEQIATLPLAEARNAELILDLPAQLHNEYIRLNLAQSLYPGERAAHIVFTPLHGTGATTAGEVLRVAGFRVDFVAEESTPDGEFPTIPYRAPNPEVKESMLRATTLAAASGADLAMACDPDADRIGVCARRRLGENAFEFLTGNEIAVLVTHFKLESLRQLGRLPKRPIVIKTEVTTEVLKAITEDFGGTMIGDLLVGFKYHGNILSQLEEKGCFRDLVARLDDFIIGVEESHGILVTPEIRDKDAAGAAILLAELAAREKRRGRTVIDYLNAIYRRYGFFANVVGSMVMSGAEGLDGIQRIQEGLRGRPPTAIGGRRVRQVIDHRDPEGIHGPIQSDTDHVARNVLVFLLEENARVVIRPSGTEPKTKVYVEVRAAPLGDHADETAFEGHKASVIQVAKAIGDDFTRQMLAVLGVELPDYALRISGLVPLDRRLHFVNEFMPELEASLARLCEQNATLGGWSCWIDEQLRSYGADARRLVGDAVQSYLAGEREKASGMAVDRVRARLQCLDAIESLFR